MSSNNNTNICSDCEATSATDDHNLRRATFQNELLSETIYKELGSDCSFSQLPAKKSSILTMKNEWPTYSAIGVQRIILEKNTKKIKSFINSLSLPSWYRGLSAFQQNSADLLLNAIRDDCGQDTVFRTMRCLESIGLDPLPTKKQLRQILPLCGGSDLALLWFLMEWLYRDDGSDSYSVNEQLIMSSIAHLDMQATLCELDRILPPKAGRNTESHPAGRKNLKNRLTKRQEQSQASVLPYLEKMPRRRPIKHHLNVKDRKPKVLDFNSHRVVDTLKAVKNDQNRWFQSYHFVDKQRTSPNFAQKDFENFLMNSEATVAEESGLQWTCRLKEDIRYLKNSLDSQLDTIAKEKAKELAQIFDRKHQSYRRLISRLQSDIQKYRQEFYAMADNCNKVLTDTPHGNEAIELSSKPSEKDSESNCFFISQNPHSFKFNYKNIFTWKDKETEATNILLDGNNELENQTPTEDCTDDEIRSRIHNLYQQALMEHKVIELATTATVYEGGNRLDYGLDYYDPDDDELMDRMLKDAIDIMKRDHRFVFASIPAAHRFPMLREWVRLRYGKKYTEKELSRYFDEAKPIFTSLVKVGLPVEMPSSNDLGRKLITNYSCRDYVIQKSNHIRDQFYNRIHKAMLAQSRVVYLAMRPFLCFKGKSFNTMFAYMPAHKRENYYFRTWKLGESTSMLRKQLSK